MTRHRSRVLATTIAASALLLTAAVPASAHITIPDGRAIVAGTTAVISLRVPHGCAGAPTDTVELKIPEGVTNVQPRLLAGWDISLEYADESESPAASAAAGGHDEEEALVSVVRWSGGSLPDALYQDFQIRASFPDAPGTVTFPVVQRCGDVEEAWIQVPAQGQDSHDLDFPAPVVTLIPADQATDTASLLARIEALETMVAELGGASPAP